MLFYSVDVANHGPRSLEESACGVVFVTCGGAKPTVAAKNFYSCKMDSFYLHDGKVLNPSQKPLSAFKWLIGLFSSDGDWILDSLSGAGDGIANMHL